MPAETTDIVIFGAGAAGLMAAIAAGRRNRRVLLLDHAERPGRKILISGGGRCNFTNLQTRPEAFLSQNPHFARSALARFTPQDFIALVERHNIPYHEKTLGQLFCDRNAHDILNLLLREAAQANVTIRTNTHITSVQGAQPFHIATSTGIVQAQSLIVTTGGLSIPKLGATGLGYTIAQSYGHTIVPCRPALVPLTMTPEDLAQWSDLAGLSTEVIATTPTPTRMPKPSFREKALITHRGLSGPAILQISSYWQPGQPIHLDPAALAQTLRTILPARLADRWTQLNLPPNWTNPSLTALDRTLHAWTIVPAGTEGYTKAEVTAGGVDTTQLDARTLQSRLVAGLYFAGEVVDVTGWLGGYNFQWAWASGHAAGQSA
jgi:predicted flavoprotein YhiN